jgi:hypothetical protein
MGPRAVLDAVVKRKIPSLRRESNLGTPIVQPVAHPYSTELSRLFVAVGYSSDSFVQLQCKITLGYLSSSDL